MDKPQNPFIEFSDSTNKIRRNLLLSSSTLLFLLVFNIKIDGFNSYGLMIKNLSIDQITMVLSFVVIYFLLSFIWHFFDEHLVWKFKLTNEDTGTTLYSLESVNEPCPLEEGNNRLNPQYFEIEKLKSTLDREISSLKKCNESCDYDNVQRYIEKAEKVCNEFFHSELRRISKFENSLKNYSNLKKGRYFILEIGVPVLLGLLSLFCLNARVLMYIQSYI